MPLNMLTPKRNVFISYHHGNDQPYKDILVSMNEEHSIYLEQSVRDGDISDRLPTETIRTKIRDNWLRNSTVTLLLVGEETRYRKHVDWELKSSMIDGSVNKRSGVLAVMLPSTGCNNFHAPFTEEKEQVYPDCNNWISVETKASYQERYPYLPERIYDNLLTDNVRFSITLWDRIVNSPDNLRLLIDLAAKARLTNQYDISRDMRMKNHNPYQTILGGIRM